MGVVAIGESGNEIMGAGQLTGMDHFLVGGFGVAPAQIVFDGAAKEQILLQNHGNLVTESMDIVIPHIHTAHLYAAFGGIVQTGDQLHQSGFTGACAAQNAHGHAGANVQIHLIQRILCGSTGVPEGNIFKGNRAVFHFVDRVFRIFQSRFFRQQLISAAHGRTAHGEHDEHHRHHHQTCEDLTGVGEHGGQLTGGQTAAAYDQFCAQIGNDDHTGVYGQLHSGAVESHDPLCLHEILINGFGGLGELLHFLILTDKGFDHTDTVEVLLGHIVQLIVGLKHPLKNGMHQTNQQNQHHRQQRQHHAEHQTQLHADAECHNQRHHQHHRGAEDHADAHLEGHLQGSHVGGQTGDDGR